MGDHQQGTLKFFQIVLQPVRHPAVQMVGGLIQHQKLRGGQKDAHQGDPLALSPGKSLHFCIKIVDSQLCQHSLCLALQVPYMGMAFIFPDDGLQDRISRCKPGILGKVADVQISPAHHRAGIRFLQPRHNF